MLIAEDLHVHPAIVAGVPGTETAWHWFVWARDRRAAEADAARQLKKVK
jgi:hypothetical protein